MAIEVFNLSSYMLEAQFSAPDELLFMKATKAWTVNRDRPNHLSASSFTGAAIDARKDDRPVSYVTSLFMIDGHFQIAGPRVKMTQAWVITGTGTTDPTGGIRRPVSRLFMITT